MADSRVAGRYVKSLLGLAVEHGVLEEVHTDMQLFTRVCKENRGFVSVLRNPIIRHEKKQSILKKVLSGKVNKLTMAFIDLVTAKNREPVLTEIAAEFHNAYNVHKGIGKASLTTTVPPDKELMSAFEALSRTLSNKKTVEMQTSVNPDLIGGFVLNVGDRQIDASIRSKLRALKLKFEENYFVKKN